MRVKKIMFIFSMFVSGLPVAQSLECQMMREEILNESRQQSQIQAQRQSQIDSQANAYAQMDPFQRATMGFYQAGAQIPALVGGVMGVRLPTLQEKVQTYKQRCE